MTYKLPDLAYDYGALEPHISGRIMELHHGKHHKTYVEGANKTLEMLQEARAAGAFDKVGALEKKLAFDLSGHVLHSIFWQNLTPEGGGEPGETLGADIARDFGSFDAFKKQLTETAATEMGSGWAVLLYEPLADRLVIGQIHDHQSSTVQGSVPLLVLDAWEHAYYLQYFNEKAKFFAAVWNLWNWPDVAARYAAARQHDLKVIEAAAKDAPRGAARKATAESTRARH